MPTCHTCGEYLPYESRVCYKEETPLTGASVIAGGYHIVAALANSAAPAQTISDYGSIGGYVPGDPSTDQGGVRAVIRVGEALQFHAGPGDFVLEPDE